MSETPDDAALLRAHVEGDPDAFSMLVRRHQDRLWAVALRTTGDREEAADAVQDALLSACRRADSFRGDAQVSTWLHRIVVNACLDRLRRRRARPSDPLPEEEDRLVALTDSPTAADPAEVSERRTDVMAALGRLTEEQRTALVLVDMEGYSVEEAAAIVGCAPGTIKSRCARGRVRLLPLLVHYRRNQIDAPDVQAITTRPRNGDRAATSSPSSPSSVSAAGESTTDTYPEGSA